MNIKMTTLFMTVIGMTQFVFAESPAPVPKTGQMVSCRTGDDGDLGAGVAWPNPRFTDLGDGTVRDNLTGLEWIRAPQALFGNLSAMNWNVAVNFCNNLVYAGHFDWRVPSHKELISLVDYGAYNPILPAGHPFVGIQSSFYWSGTSSAVNAGYAWGVDIGDGRVYGNVKASTFYVWPVRNGR